MTESLGRVAHQVHLTLKKIGFDHFFIGGFAALRWGRPRQTQDLDLSIFLELGDEMKVIRKLLKQYQPRAKDSAQIAREGRVLTLVGPQKVPLDVGLASTEFERGALSRTSMWTLDTKTAVPTCSAEDLIIYKAFADRPIDWIDIRNVLMVNHGNLDWELIDDTLPELLELKEDLAPLRKLQKLKTEVRASLKQM
jgi:Nucleotidyl transferase AbiEii toxin, Type IV TA system